MLPTPPKYATWLAVLRIYTGIFWLLHGVPKLLNPNFASPDGGMAGMVTDMGSKTSGAYHDFIMHTVLPNAPVFAHLVAWGETLVGVSLLLGLLTRVGGFFGVLLPLNYWLAKGSYGEASGFAGLDFAAMALSFVSLVLPTGLVLGLDGVLWRKRSANPEGKT